MTVTEGDLVGCRWTADGNCMLLVGCVEKIMRDAGQRIFAVKPIFPREFASADAILIPQSNVRGCGSGELHPGDQLFALAIDLMHRIDELRDERDRLSRHIVDGEEGGAEE